MNVAVNLLKQTIRIGSFGAGLLFAASVTANAQGVYYDPYYGQQNNGYYNQNRRNDNRHRRQENCALNYHQHQEREVYGNSPLLHYHQEQERRQLRRHQQYERYRGYYNNGLIINGYYYNQNRPRINGYYYNQNRRRNSVYYRNRGY